MSDSCRTLREQLNVDSDTLRINPTSSIGVCCQLVALVCALLAPYMPDTCRTLREQLNVDSDTLRINPT
ncbi:Methionyl-tRNA synthetase [Operophtera brumata]|uniref:Methionyl-tRNA synthetase n=1 Tax=Operophtera brumata TaxID=104452 RepID=A0A0L7LJ34_OPEBR|nr:Methionyl-tRNA synthetase [Operophtera brumata]